MPGGSRIRVRMYRQGLGDCLLLSIIRGEGKPFHMMFDCGVILGTKRAKEIMGTVVDDICKDTGGHVDVLVVTHEHYDHVSGFKLAADRFTPAAERAAGKLSVGAVWYAWTERPGDPVAEELRRQRKDGVKALAELASKLALDGSAESGSPMLQAALAFVGVAADGTDKGDTAQAMAFPATLVAGPDVHYLEPGQTVCPPDADELRIFVLGPPKDPRFLKQTDSAPEVYHVEGSAVLPGFLRGDGRWRPFDETWSNDLVTLQAQDGPPGQLRDLLRERYYGPPAPDPRSDPAWRRIDDQWLAGTEQFALAMDNATNNTSVALAIEVISTGEILLFPADAQVGSWLSWQALTWDVDGKTVTLPELFARTVFYKVGHHGSGNATLKAKGLEMMTSQKLTAFVPVDHDMAVKKRWGNMPLPSLVADLKARTRNRMVRIDDAAPPPEWPEITSGGAGGPYADGHLYFEWSMPVVGTA